MRPTAERQRSRWVSQHQRDGLLELYLLVCRPLARLAIVSSRTPASYANVTLGQTCVNENKAYVAYENGVGSFAQIISRDK